MAKATCSVEGCDKPVHGRGWCGTHYRRWRTHGDPSLIQRFGDDRPYASFEDRFWSKVQATGFCWIWIGYFGAHGYGYVARDGKRFLVHRVSYELLIGPIPEGLALDHLCRNTSCVNPDHLEPVTDRENTLRGFGWAGRHARKTHCIRGHEFTPENTMIDSRGGRACRACRAIYESERAPRVLTERARERAREATRRYRERQKATLQVR